MLAAIGAASSAIELFKSLTSATKTSSTRNADFNASTATSASTTTSASSVASTSVSGTSSQSGAVSPETMSALLDAQSQSTATGSSTTASKSQSKALKDLFDQIDGDGDGSITKSEFENALGAGGTNTANADSVFSKLDKDSDGKVSLDELSAALKGGKSKRAHQAKPPGEPDQISQTDPLLKALDEANEASSASRSAASTYKANDQVIQRQQAAAAAASASTLSVSA